MQRLFVHHIGAITHAEIELQDFTVLIGEQASGKSTLAKLVYFFKSLRGDLVTLARQHPPAAITQQRVNNAIRDRFYLYFGSTRFLTPDYEIQFFYTDECSIHLSGSPLQVDLAPREGWELVSTTLREYASRIQELRQRNELLAAFQEEGLLESWLANFFQDSYKNLYIPDGRNITVSYGEVFEGYFRERFAPVQLQLKADGIPRHSPREIDRLLLYDFILHVEKLLENYKGVGFEGLLRELPSSLSRQLYPRINSLLKAKYRHSEGLGEYLKVDGSEEKILLRNASSGQKECLRIVQDIVHELTLDRPSFRVIEEPEAHLFPSGQRILVELLAAFVRGVSNPNSVLITTHSPYILSVLNNLMYAHDLLTRNDSAKTRKAVQAAGFPEEVRLEPARVAAYMIQNGVCLSIIDPETGLIGGNLMEDAWDGIQNSFNTLYALDV